MNPIKPGWQTSEWWLAVGHQLLAVLVLLGIVPAADATGLDVAIAHGISAVFALAASAWVVVSYIKSRENLKTLEPTSPAEETKS